MGQSGLCRPELAAVRKPFSARTVAFNKIYVGNKWKINGW